MVNNNNPKIGGGIICHHIPVAKALIDGFFKEIQATENNYDLIIIAGPNHFGLGEGDIQIATEPFKTDYGQLEVNQEVAQLLITNNLCQREETTFFKEHSIFAIAKPVSFYFPKAKILPLVISSRCAVEKLDHLAEVLFNESRTKKILMVASIDFSHYLQRKIALFHDQVSASAIRGFDFKKIREIEGDSNNSLYLLLRYLEKGEFFKAKIKKSNSAFWGAGLATESSVSYLNTIFTKGSRPKTQTATSVVCYYNQNNRDFFSQDFSPAFSRTFLGVDLVVLWDQQSLWVLERTRFLDYFNRKIKITEFSDCLANSLLTAGEPIIKETSQGKIAFWDLEYLKYKDLKERPNLEQKIKRIKRETDHLFVFCRWGKVAGESAIGKEEQDFAEFLTRSGAEVVFGSGVRLVPAEIKNNCPIFYSFEEKESPRFQMGVGVNIFPNKKNFFLLPFGVSKEGKRDFFNYLSAENNAHFIFKNIPNREDNYLSLVKSSKEVVPVPWDVEEARQEVLDYLRWYAVKLNYFVKKDAGSGKIRTYERPYGIESGEKVPGDDASFMMDVREILGYDRSISLIAKILLTYLRQIKSKPRLLIGFETSSFPIMGAILALNDVFFPQEKLEVCYIRKESKKGDLCLQMEGTRNYQGRKAVFVDDITNRGTTITKAKGFTEQKGIILVGALVVIGNKTKESTGVVAGIPYRCVASLNEIKKKEDFFLPEKRLKNYDSWVHHRSHSGLDEVKEDPLETKNESVKEGIRQLKKSDIEIAKLAKDAATALLFSNFGRKPHLLFDEKGSFGYLPFLRKYLLRKGRVAVLINKRELRRGHWFNRRRGFAFNNILADKKNYLNGVVNCVSRALKETPRIAGDGTSFSIHKPIWLSELGSLSFFVYLMEEEKEIKIKSIEELKATGHDLNCGLAAVYGDFQGFVPGNLNCFSTVEDQVAFLLKSMNNGKAFGRFNLPAVKLFTIKGHWAFAPERSMADYFNFLDTIPPEAINER